MKVLVTASARFAITRDGHFWTPNASLGHHFWTRYLDAYDEVHLCVRAEPHLAPPEGWKQVSGPGIKAIPLPDFDSVKGFVKRFLPLKKAIKKELAQVEAVQLRLPCTIGEQVWYTLPSDRPYGVEVVGDPYDAFTPHSIKHPLRPFFRWWYPHGLRRQCAKACAVSYVTEWTLQRSYPPGPNTFSTYYSDVELPEEAFATAPRSFSDNRGPIRLILVGTLAQLYKGPNVLIDAVALCVQEGLDLRLVLVGDGRHQAELEAQVTAMALGERVQFCGQLTSRQAVQDQLDQADLFVLPSKTEGLPRALIEAMARALPCLGSSVGGIPELLPPEDMVPPSDVAALAKKVRDVITNPERMACMSTRNLEKAKLYREEVLRERRVTFYCYMREQTEAWLRTQGRGGLL